MPYMEMEHKVDPKQKLIEELGDISNYEICNNLVLVAVYLRPEKTKSGLIMTDKHLDEDKFQSKVGLIVGHGPLAFKPTGDGWFEQHKFKMHDWVVSRPSNSWSITINGVLCRLVRDNYLDMIVPHPDGAW